MPPRRFVLDTNIVLSALLFRKGVSTWIREAWRAERIVPLASSATTRELLRALTYPKFSLTEQDQRELLADYLPWCEVVAVEADTPIPECRDPSDLPFLQLAVSGGADALVTGDSDLLSIAPVSPVPIITAREAQKRLTKS